MLRLAGREADGAIINWLSADDVRTTVAEVGPGKEIVARIFVCPTEDAERARAVGRIAVAAYLNVAVYAAFHRWLGRGPLLEEMWAAWAAGDRKARPGRHPRRGGRRPRRPRIATTSAGPTSGRYVDNGVTVPVLALLPGGDDLATSVEGLAPSSD